MPLLQLLAVIVILGFVVYLIESYLPMSEPFKTLFRFVVVIIVIYLLLSLVGVVPPLRLT